MIQYTITLVWFDLKGVELKTVHEELHEKLIRRWGYAERVPSTIFYRDVETNKFTSEPAFKYSVYCEAKEEEEFVKTAKEYGRKCGQASMVVVCANQAQAIDLKDMKDIDNWRSFANERLAERDRHNSHWVKPVSTKAG